MRNAWQEQTIGCDFGEKLRRCGEILMAWDTNQFGHVRKKIKDLREKLDHLQKLRQSEAIVIEANETEKSLNQRLKLEEAMWHQRSRILWLKDEDKNSKFFHTKASQRKKRNAITRICNEEGQWVSQRKAVEKMLVQYF